MVDADIAHPTAEVAEVVDDEDDPLGRQPAGAVNALMIGAEGETA
jgi:hypothetical protein